MDDVELGENVDSSPRVGMIFNSEQDAYDFYNSYGGRLGFSIRRDFAHKRKKDMTVITSRRLFGDVVSFDTTFRTNKEYRPFGIFAGFNHHRGVIIFGVALLYDETAESFNWLFEAFAEANGNKKPITIFTDQDTAMEKALYEVWPGTWHGLCTWHIMQNGIEHLGHIMKDGSCFLKYLKKCIFEYEEELQFENSWKKLLCDYNLEQNSWLLRIYGIKCKWAKCYMKNTFTIGMRSTQISESFNSDLKEYLKSTLDVVQFFKHFERVVNTKRANELKAEFDSRNKLPRNMFGMSLVIKQAGDVYTPYIFEKFQEYCKKYETFGILCCHCLKVLDVLDIKCIPDSYILRRWTRAARSMVVEDHKGKQVVEDVNLDCTQRYRYLSPQLVKIALQASNSVEGFALVKNGIKELCQQLESINVSDVPKNLVPNEFENVFLSFSLSATFVSVSQSSTGLESKGHFIPSKWKSLSIKQNSLEIQTFRARSGHGPDLHVKTQVQELWLDRPAKIEGHPESDLSELRGYFRNYSATPLDSAPLSNVNLFIFPKEMLGLWVKEKITFSILTRNTVHCFSNNKGLGT
ncbi:protein FAR1-RELATED SEQUENCE 5-like [Macadamia integrifolia]|uniref:protein FAR1-RELATED SEQUENCE 5-like n=1 Tax=Macadamia integrifolia TaxID=60698 RepID=UPI001C4EEA34|nr:protein FAR1-RELATED SEQUENCE 5-like [Macadamia integrifolia]